MFLAKSPEKGVFPDLGVIFLAFALWMTALGWDLGWEMEMEVADFDFDGVEFFGLFDSVFGGVDFGVTALDFVVLDLVPTLLSYFFAFVEVEVTISFFGPSDICRDFESAGECSKLTEANLTLFWVAAFALDGVVLGGALGGVLGDALGFVFGGDVEDPLARIAFFTGGNFFPGGTFFAGIFLEA